MSEKESLSKIDDMIATLEGMGASFDDFSISELQEAAALARAAKEIEALQRREGSSVQVGQKAPDFRLAHLAADAGEPIQLSERFGSRPVALVFGSYT